MVTILRRPVVALMAAAVLLLSSCGSNEPDEDASPSPSEPAQELIEYDQDEAVGVNLTQPSEVSKLVGAPADFKQFIAGIIEASASEATDDCKVQVGVAKIDTSGYAAGSIRSCGGAVYIWAKRDGVWQEIWGGQELPQCADMKKHSVPKAIAGDRCYEGNDEVEYSSS
jgi:hypothetical protein